MHVVSAHRTTPRQASTARNPTSMTHVQAICFDWGGTLMSDDGPADRPMALWPEVKTMSGAATTLAALQHIGPLCIATNASMSHRPMVERALARGGLLHYFSHVFCATDLGVRKESPQFWAAVTAALDCPPQHVAMVGDSLESDVFAPQRFGMQAVWFNEGGRQAPPSVSVPAITHLPELVALLGADRPA
jgi:FMN phosphatase YigB (HAD superfamily)